jgi:hypothetical protein
MLTHQLPQRLHDAAMLREHFGLNEFVDRHRITLIVLVISIPEC